MGSHYRKSEFKIYLGYSESRYGGGIVEGQEDEDWPSYEDSNIDFRPEGLYIESSSSQETVGVDFNPKNHLGQNVYMVVVRYYDGDTFGRTCGYWYIPLITLQEKEAFKIKEAIEDGSYNPPEGCYQPWTSYFAGLEGVSIWGTKIREGKCSGIKWF